MPRGEMLRSVRDAANMFLGDKDVVVFVAYSYCRLIKSMALQPTKIFFICVCYAIQTIELVHLLVALLMLHELCLYCPCIYTSLMLFRIMLSMYESLS
jgi:hypothetical protein